MLLLGLAVADETSCDLHQSLFLREGSERTHEEEGEIEAGKTGTGEGGLNEVVPCQLCEHHAKWADPHATVGRVQYLAIVVSCKIAGRGRGGS